MIETLDSLTIAAEQLIVRGRRELHGILYANVWCESDDRRHAWHEHRVLAVTVAAFPDRVAAAAAGKRLWGARGRGAGTAVIRTEGGRMDEGTRVATLAEIDRALGELHAAAHEAMRARDDDRYRALARRYERLRRRREAVQPPRVGPDRAGDAAAGDVPY